MQFITFANIEPKREKEAYLAVAHKIPTLKGVKGVYLTFGKKDVVVLHEAPDLNQGVHMAVKLRNIPGIMNTETIVCLDIEEVFSEKE
ncbi:MAG: Lrp/AsnC ligand binding domain-containing protein [Candidatus Odinarchaeum yellowstonii]|uniref:Lrp/AsnC ligand binding domain-containing protein n=1 Tax=Odinarchaeota yellowstonii (strain LCB_4) TaxID=1841599 RepID=A0AAF0D166_ODILC|nr:MAG: Lrp/AsnC ligand binding domain-containing protein [Candidatus Odinarchaeum yellowstonii]